MHMRWALPGFLGALTKLLMKYIREREMYLFLFQNSKSQCQGIVILSAVLLSIPLIGLPAEVLQRSGVASFAEARWWAVGAAKLAGEDLNYLGVAGLRLQSATFAGCSLAPHLHAFAGIARPV